MRQPSLVQWERLPTIFTRRRLWFQRRPTWEKQLLHFKQAWTAPDHQQRSSPPNMTILLQLIKLRHPQPPQETKVIAKMTEHIFIACLSLSFAGDYIDSDCTAAVIPDPVSTKSRFLHKFSDWTDLRSFTGHSHSMDDHQLYNEWFQFGHLGSDHFHNVQRTVHSITDPFLWYLSTALNCDDGGTATASILRFHLCANNTFWHHGEPSTIRNVDHYSWPRARFDPRPGWLFGGSRWKYAECQCKCSPSSSGQAGLSLCSLHRIGTTCTTVESMVCTIFRMSMGLSCPSMIRESIHRTPPAYPKVPPPFVLGDTALRAVRWRFFRNPSSPIEPTNLWSSWRIDVIHRYKQLVICSFA